MPLLKDSQSALFTHISFQPIRLTRSLFISNNISRLILIVFIQLIDDSYNQANILHFTCGHMMTCFSLNVDT